MESFRVEVSVTSKGAITGEEALELSLANELSSASQAGWLIMTASKVLLLRLLMVWATAVIHTAIQI